VNETNPRLEIPFANLPKVSSMSSIGPTAVRAVNPSDEVTDKLLAYQNKCLAVSKRGRIGALIVYMTHSLPGGRENVVKIDFRCTTAGPAPREVQTIIDGLEFVSE
jgi:hypothetical protein